MAVASQAFYSMVAPVAYSSGTAASGFPASNAANTSVKKPWQATGVAADYLQFDFGATISLAAVCVQDVNFASATVLADNNPTPVTTIGTINCAQDDQGRYKGSLVAAISARYLRISIAAGSTLDGAVGWRIGCLYPFASSLSLPKDPLFGGSSLESNFPQNLVQLDNDIEIRDTTGPSFARITLDYSGAATDPLTALARRARLGVCWINLNVGALQFPVRHNEPKITRKLQAYNRELVTFMLKEEV